MDEIDKADVKKKERMIWLSIFAGSLSVLAILIFLAMIVLSIVTADYGRIVYGLLMMVMNFVLLWVHFTSYKENKKRIKELKEFARLE